MDTTLKENIDWVGHVDWVVRDFHGYDTERGSTYNAYLLRDGKNALIDTVKAPYAADLLEHVAALLPPDRLDYIVCNHAEPDHSGALPAVVAACPQAVVVCDQKCRTALGQHYDTTNWKFQVVADGDRLSLGRRTLVFVETPMVHWPESMATYVPEEKLLFSMDAFGQHLATSHRFDDEEDLHTILSEAKTYYANIVMLYGKQVLKTLERAAQIEIEMVAPSHGVIWRSHLGEILAAYQDWARCKPARKVLVIYDSMWQSTARMAQAINEGASQPGVEVKLFPIRASNITVLATEMLDAAVVAFGSPTLNQTLMPAAAGLLTYLKGLKPVGKAGLAFGSYGWSKGGAEAVDAFLREMKVDILREPLVCQYAPSRETLEACRAAGRLLADRARQA